MSSTITQTTALLISDSSTLINFLRIDRTDLLTSLPFSLQVTDVVRAEITTRYQSQKLEEAIARGEFGVTALSDLADLQLMASFQASGLGAGESASIAAAVRLGGTLAMDDQTAIKRAQGRYPGLAVLTTQEIMVLNIRQGTVSVADADAIKEDWALNHRFALKIGSFADLVS